MTDATRSLERRTLAGRGSASAAAVAYRIRHGVRRSLDAQPAVYLPIARRKHPGSVLDDDTYLVIDGFTRSAVTFAVVAFQLAQNDHVRVAHHLHSASHLIAAAERGVPTLVPVRPPEDTILSALIREPLVTPRQFLKSYIAFYRRILPYRSRLFIASFDEVTRDLGVVIRHLNERFGTTFEPFEHTDENVRTCFEVIEERASRPPWQGLLGAFLSGRTTADEYLDASRRLREQDGGRTVPENRVQRPSEGRQAAKERFRAGYEKPELAVLRETAERAFAEIVIAP